MGGSGRWLVGKRSLAARMGVLGTSVMMFQKHEHLITWRYSVPAADGEQRAARVRCRQHVHRWRRRKRGRCSCSSMHHTRQRRHSPVCGEAPDRQVPMSATGRVKRTAASRHSMLCVRLRVTRHLNTPTQTLSACHIAQGLWRRARRNLFRWETAGRREF